MNKISVVVPVYNVRKYVERCVDSLLKQSYSDIEVLLIDNGSTDGCSEIVDYLACSNERIKAYHLEEKGVSRARNVGINMSTGDFIAFCDSDDFLPSDALEHMVNTLICQKKDLCIGRYRELINGREEEEIDPFFEKECIDDQDVINTIGVNRQWNGGGYIWNKLFRSSVIKTSPAIQFDETMDCYEDLKFVLEYINRTKKFAKLNEAVYVYNRDNVQSISHMQIDYDSVSKLKGLEKVCEMLDSFPGGTIAALSRKNQLLLMCTSFYGRLIVTRSDERGKCMDLIKRLVRSNAHGFKPDSSWGTGHRVIFHLMKIRAMF